MSALPDGRIAELLEPFYPAPRSELVAQLSIYLDLLLKWNAKTNLTAIRGAEEIVTRHFGESLFLACHLPACSTVLDLGSGAGFPGIPVQLAMRHVRVTLAESQNKKAAFLREAVRILNLPCEVWGARVEEIPVRLFDAVVLRAVDNPFLAMALARKHLRKGGTIAYLTSTSEAVGRQIALPGRTKGVLRLLTEE